MSQIVHLYAPDSTHGCLVTVEFSTGNFPKFRETVYFESRAVHFWGLVIPGSLVCCVRPRASPSRYRRLQRGLIYVRTCVNSIYKWPETTIYYPPARCLHDQRNH
ncbi:hypothetical protein AG1IA_00135 [Rhizoctonia solani AG-1 IA]|uniref:Uncharacterized protein n=1 Tax=Thanatephorus cucumeris (strain AG1-IA) TaxID=983506 RepID=L8X9T9_THACA|nr:hypothetical protein AG1IA_00135 [Rhizoctonia solani AG-1 IA]